MFYHLKICFRISCIIVIKKDSPYSSHLSVTVKIHKVLVTLLFHILIETIRGTGLFPNPMKIMKVFNVWVVRSKICSSSEPKFISLLNHSEISMNSRYTRIDRMNNQRNPCGPHLISSSFKNLSKLGIYLSKNTACIHSLIFKNTSLKGTSDSTTSWRPHMVLSLP